MLETIRRHRQSLHRIPELGFDLPRREPTCFRSFPA